MLEMPELKPEMLDFIEFILFSIGDRFASTVEIIGEMSPSMLFSSGVRELTTPVLKSDGRADMLA